MSKKRWGSSADPMTALRPLGVGRALPGLLALALVGSATSARASCPQTAMPNALALRVDQPTLRKMVDVGLDYVPESLALPQAEWEIFSCGFGLKAWVETKRTDVRLEILSHEVSLDGDALLVVATANLYIDGDVGAALCDIETECQLAATVLPATITGRAKPAIDQCELRTTFEDVSIEVDSDDVEIELSGCSIVSSLVELVLDGFQSIILRFVIPYLEDYVVEDFPRIIEEAQLGLALPSFSAYGMNVEVAPDAVRFEGDSAFMSAQAWVEPSGPIAACVPPSADFVVEDPSSDPIAVQLREGEGARVGASEPFLQQLLLSAWAGGLFCFDLEALGVDLATPLEPIFPGVKLSTEIRSASAPRLSLAPNGERDVLLEVDALEAAVLMSLPGDEPVMATARTGARISGRVVVDPASTAVAIEPSAVDVLPASVELPTRTLGISEEGLEALFDDTLAPMLFGETGRLVILDAIFAGAPVALELLDVEAQPGLLEVGMQVWAKPKGDVSAPRTALAEDPDELCDGDLAIRTNSVDDLTPAGLLRHQLSIDGVPEESPRAGQRFTVFGLAPGAHRIELRAMDLSDNIGQPVVFEVVVDTEPPEVEIVERPEGVIHVHEAEWRVTAVDDHSPSAKLTGRFTIDELDAGTGERSLLIEGPFVVGQPLRLEGFPEDKVMEVRFWVSDEAGNEAEVATGFAVDTSPTVGCTASGARPAWPLFLGLGLFWLRRRRKGDICA